MSDENQQDKRSSALETRREDRKDVTVSGRYRAGMSGTRDIYIKDISTGGCRMFDKYSRLPVGREISFKVGNIGPIPALVRWREGSTVGVSFEEPLHEAVLGHIVNHMDEQDRVAD